MIGIGIDLVDVARVERMLARHGNRILDRLLTQLEQEYCRDAAFPARHVAVRIAAKEAAFKALAGNRLAQTIGWLDLEVVSSRGQAPELRLHGRAVRRAREIGVSRVMISLTHSETAAAAMAVAVGSGDG